MYCTDTDILGVIPELELIQLTDDSVPPVIVDTSVTAQAIAQAASLINGYIGGRYQIPLVTVPELVISIALDITVYKLYLRRKKRALPEGIKTGYEDAMKQLRDVQAGKLSLGVDSTGDAAAVTTSGSPSMVSNSRISSRDTMAGY